MPESSSPSSQTVDVLIVGAGPTGLTAACEAHRHNLSVRIIDAKPKRYTNDSRALVVHPRNLELLDKSVVNRILSKVEDSYMEVVHAHTILGEKEVTISPSQDGAWGDTIYKNVHILPQYDTEASLEEELHSVGIFVEYGKKLHTLTQEMNQAESLKEGCCTAVLKVNLDDKEEEEEIIRATFVIGCDGGRSQTRSLVGLSMSRANSNFHLIVADVSIKRQSTAAHNEDDLLKARHAHFFLGNPDGILLFIPYFNSGSSTLNHRMVVKAPPGVTNGSELTSDMINILFRDRTGITDATVNIDGKWATVFEITHGIASSYRAGNVFLAGDASHVHSPVGGQGMGAGMQDSLNLVWKLAWVKRIMKSQQSQPQSNDAQLPIQNTLNKILDSYDTERKSWGQSLLKFTELSTRAIMTSNFMLRECRNLMIRNVWPTFAPTKVRTLAQLDGVSYSHVSSPIIMDTIVVGTLGSYVQGWWLDDSNRLPTREELVCIAGERLPNLQLEEGKCLYESVYRHGHSWVVINGAKSTTPAIDNTNEDKSASNLQTQGCGGLPVLFVTLAKQQASRPYIADIAFNTPQALLIRPDLHVAAINYTMKGVWESTKNKLDEHALKSM